MSLWSTGVKNLPMIKSLLIGEDLEKLRAQVKLEGNRFLLIEALAQCGSLLYKKRIDFCAHTFLASIQELHLILPNYCQEATIEVVIVKKSSKSIGCKIKCFHQNLEIAFGSFLFSQESWSPRFTEAHLKDLYKKRVWELEKAGKKGE